MPVTDSLPSPSNVSSSNTAPYHSALPTAFSAKGAPRATARRTRTSVAATSGRDTPAGSFASLNFSSSSGLITSRTLSLSFSASPGWMQTPCATTRLLGPT